MYKYEDFKEEFGSESIDRYLITTVHTTAKRFEVALKSNVTILTRAEMLGFGDSFMNLVCIDRLEELGFIECVEKQGISNHWKYRNLRLK